MFGIGFSELMLILIIALIAIGPEKLPDIARALGRAFGEFKKATDELKKSVAEADVTKDLDVMGKRPDVSGTSDAGSGGAKKKAKKNREA